MTPKELTTEAWLLFERMRNLKSQHNQSLHQKAKLNHLAAKAHARYRRRLEAWWEQKPREEYRARINLG